jgi:ribonucleotide monophosphatase NagD (HAD superfamily)
VLAALYLQKNHPDIKQAFVIGMSGIVEDLKTVGIETIDHNIVVSPDIKEYSDYSTQEDVVKDNIKAVVISSIIFLNKNKNYLINIFLRFVE